MDAGGDVRLAESAAAVAVASGARRAYPRERVGMTMGARIRFGALGAFVALLALVPSAMAAIATTPEPFWQVNGRVNAIMQINNVTYVGGKFTQVSDHSGHTLAVSNLAAIDSAGHAVATWTPDAGNTVKTIATDGAGHIIIGGSFNKIDGVGRPHIAELSSSGSLISKTTFAATADGDVQAFATNGSTLYIGGQFQNVDGASHPFLGAVSLTDGTLRAWNPFVDGRVDALEVNNAGAVVAGGFFLNAGNSTSAQAATAAFDPTTGALQAGYVNNSSSGIVSIAQATDGSIFTGSFGNRLQRFTPTGVLSWRDTTDGNIQAMTMSDGELILGGHFVNVCVGGTCTVRHHIAAVDPASGALDTGWAPNVNSDLGVFAEADTSIGLAIGGDFTAVGGVAQAHLAFLQTGSSVPVDALPPTIGLKPDASLRKATTISSGQVPLLVRFAAADPSGVCSYRLQRSVGSGTFANVSLAAKTATTKAVSLAPATTHRYRVSATDCVGNASAFATGPAVILSAFQDGNARIAYTRAWTHAAAPKAWGGGVHLVSKAGAHASLRFTGREVAWVASRTATRGSARVYLDGKLAATVNLRSATPIHRRLVFAHVWKTDAVHTIKIVCAGTAGHSTIDVDAIVTVR